jgi:hypothetical protein
VADLAINTPPNPYTAFQSPDAPSRSNASAQWLAVVTETTARPADRNPAANNGDADGPGGVPVTRLLSMSEQQLLDYIDEKMAEARSAGTPADRERALDDAVNAAYAWRAQGGTDDGFDRVRAQLVDSGADKTYVNVVQRRADQVVASGASDFIRPLNNAGDNFGAPLQELQRAIDNDPDHAPRISQIAWGTMEVNGVGFGRDFKLFPGGGRPWDWTETNTHHVPGIQIADVEELLDRGSRVVVLSRGMQLVLRTCPEVLDFLRERNIPVFVEETRSAVEIYNRLAGHGERVGGLFHSTC